MRVSDTSGQDYSEQLSHNRRYEKLSPLQRSENHPSRLKGARGPRGLAAVLVGVGGAWPGTKQTHQAADQLPGHTGVEGAGGTGGHGRASRRGAERSEVA